MTLPKQDEIKTFTQEATRAFKDLKFETKQAIVRSVIEKVVGTKTELQVFGYIPININVFTLHRNRRIAERG